MIAQNIKKVPKKLYGYKKGVIEGTSMVGTEQKADLKASENADLKVSESETEFTEVKGLKKIVLWKKYKERFEEQYNKENKDEKVKFIKTFAKEKKIVERQGMADLHATYNDAQYMYDFLSEKVCPNVSDITVMSN